MDKFLILSGENIEQFNINHVLSTYNIQLNLKTDKVIRYFVPDDFVYSDQMKRELLGYQIDSILVPVRKFSDIGLIVSDMDSTLITIECIDEIAAMVDIKDKISKITEQTMTGELDFEASLKSRVSWLKGVTVKQLEHVLNHVLTLSPGAQFLIKECQLNQIEFVLVSGGFTFFTDYLKQILRLSASYSNQLEIKNGILTGNILGPVVDAHAKANYLKLHRHQLGLQSSQVIAVGDGANDIEMLMEAGISVAYHAKSKVKKIADISIDFSGLDLIRYCFL